MRKLNSHSIAKLTSFLFHPFVFFMIMPFILIYRESASSAYALKWQIFSSVFVFLGLTIYFIGWLRGYFSDYDISKRRERYAFFMISWVLATLYLVAAIFFKGILFPMSVASLGIVIGIILFAIANYFMKISIHTAVACAFVLAIGLLYGLKAFLIVSWILPVLYWSRTILGKHTVAELISGSLLGGIITLLTFIIGKFLYYG